MAIYSIKINEKSETGRNLLNLLQSMTDVVSITPQTEQGIEFGKISKEEFMSDLKQSLSEAQSNHTQPLKNLIDG